MKITYPLSTLPEHIHSTICTIDKDGGMCCIYKKAEAKRETVTYRQYQLTYGVWCQSQDPGGVLQDRQVMCQVRKVIIIRWRDWVKAPTRTQGPPSRTAGKGSQQPKARKTGPAPHYVYRWMLQELLSWLQVRHETESWKCEKGTLSLPSHSSRHVSN